MDDAVCFKCGAAKNGALTACSACGEIPRTDSELALSLVLCAHISTMDQLAKFSYEIRANARPSVLKSQMSQANEALKDPQLMAMLGDRKTGPHVETAVLREGRDNQKISRSPEQVSLSSRRARSIHVTALQKNPFAILGATTRDDRRRIVELAEEKSLSIDHDTCQKARSDLTNPRTRVSAELSWMPGVSPRRAAQLNELILRDPMALREESGLPSLAHANLMAAAFEAIDEADSAADVAEFIQEMATLAGEISVDEVLRDINEDRSVAGFPEVRAAEQIEAELADRRRYYRAAIKDALNRLPPKSLVEAMTLTVDGATYGGELHAPELIDELVDGYAVETQGFLQREAESAERLMSAIRSAAKSNESGVGSLIDKLETVARNWDKVAQPIQLSAKARGIDHDASHEVAYSIRGLAIELFNDHDLLTHSQRLTALIKELFAELPEVSEKIDQDSKALSDIFLNRRQAEAQKDQWAKDVTYRAELGLIFKDVLSISPTGVSWKNLNFPLDSVTRIRWGGVRQSVNGVPTGTTYTLAFGDGRTEAVVELQKENVYSAFVDRLWRAVGIRLLGEILGALKAGKELRFGDAMLRDDGITLMKHKFFGTEPVRCGWSQVHVWNADGAFYIGAKDDKKTYVCLSYINSPNTHVLEQAIRMAFEKPGLRRLSDLLQ